MEPSLRNIDLSPYFYLIREKFHTIPKFARRLSPEMQEIIANLLSESEAIRKSAIQKANTFDLNNLTVIFDNISARFLSTKNESILDSLFELAKISQDISVKLIDKLSEIPESDLKSKAAIQISELARIYPTLKSSIGKKLSEWEKSTNTKFAKAAKLMKERL